MILHNIVLEADIKGIQDDAEDAQENVAGKAERQDGQGQADYQSLACLLVWLFVGEYWVMGGLRSLKIWWNC